MLNTVVTRPHRWRLDYHPIKSIMHCKRFVRLASQIVKTLYKNKFHLWKVKGIRVARISNRGETNFGQLWCTCFIPHEFFTRDVWVNSSRPNLSYSFLKAVMMPHKVLCFAQRWCQLKMMHVWKVIFNLCWTDKARQGLPGWKLICVYKRLPFHY